MVWNWYQFVAIAILHQPRPTDSADINTRLQLNDTSSIPPMHDGFLFISCTPPYHSIVASCLMLGWFRWNWGIGIVKTISNCRWYYHCILSSLLDVDIKYSLYPVSVTRNNLLNFRIFTYLFFLKYCLVYFTYNLKPFAKRIYSFVSTKHTSWHAVLSPDYSWTTLLSANSTLQRG